MRRVEILRIGLGRAMVVIALDVFLTFAAPALDGRSRPSDSAVGPGLPGV